MAVKPKSYASQTELGKRLGVTQQRISELRRDPDWRWPGPPWSERHVSEIAADLANRRAMNNASASAAADRAEDDDTLAAVTRSPERRAKLMLIIKRTAKIELETQLLAGGYVKKEDVDARNVAKVYAVRQKLQELALRAPLIANKSEAECAAILTEFAKEVCDTFSKPVKNADRQTQTA